MTEVWNAEDWRNYQAKQDKARDSRYGAVPMTTADGRKFPSTLQGMYYNRCLVLQKAGEITNIEHEVWFEFVVNGVLVGRYRLDFRVTYADGRVEHIDTKSKPTLTALYLMKKALMLACHGITVREVYEEDLHQTGRGDRKKNKERRK